MVYTALESKGDIQIGNKDGTHTYTHTQVPVHDTAEMYHSNLSFENKMPSAKKKRER